MAAYTQILYHIVFGTKDRRQTLDAENHESLWKYVSGVIRGKQCAVYTVGGFTEHIHILCSLHPSMALADMVKDIKLAVSAWNKAEKVFPAFSGWAEGYGAFTCSVRDKDRIYHYIRNQHEHHRVKSYQEELEEMLRKAGVEYDRRYL